MLVVVLLLPLAEGAVGWETEPRLEDCMLDDQRDLGVGESVVEDETAEEENVGGGVGAGAEAPVFGATGKADSNGHVSSVNLVLQATHRKDWKTKSANSTTGVGAWD